MTQTISKCCKGYLDKKQRGKRLTTRLSNFTSFCHQKKLKLYLNHTGKWHLHFRVGVKESESRKRTALRWACECALFNALILQSLPDSSGSEVCERSCSKVEQILQTSKVLWALLLDGTFLRATILFVWGRGFF